MESGSKLFLDDKICSDGEEVQHEICCDCSKSLLAGTKDSQKFKTLMAKKRDLERVNEIRVEQLKILEADKKALEVALEGERSFFKDMYEKGYCDYTSRIAVFLGNWMSAFESKHLQGNLEKPTPQPLHMETESRRKLQKSLDGMRTQLNLRSEERDKWKSKCKTLTDDLLQSQNQLMHATSELAQLKAGASKVAIDASKDAELNEVCRDLLAELERRNNELQKYKKDRRKTAEIQVQLQQQIEQYKDENQKLKTFVDDQKHKSNETTECIICLDDFGAEPDRCRAHWIDCNHANICYKCTIKLWNTNRRTCPSCNTPASTMPTRLPPHIFF